MPVVSCPVHGDQPTEIHHKVPRMRGGTDDPENLVALCRECHRELHQVDSEMHRPGFLALAEKLGDNLREYMAELGRRGIRSQRERLGEEAFRALQSERRRRQVRKAA